VASGEHRPHHVGYAKDKAAAGRPNVTARIRDLNDAARKWLASNIATNALDASREVVITRGVSRRKCVMRIVMRRSGISRERSCRTPPGETNASAAGKKPGKAESTDSPFIVALPKRGEW
jgi:hypothetical protein